MNISLPLQEFVSRYCERYLARGQSFIFDCPLCASRKKLYIRKSDGRFICFKCKEENGFSGRAEYALTHLTGLSVNEIKEAIYGISTDGKPYIEDHFFEDEEIIEESEVVITDWPSTIHPIESSLSQRGANYLVSRGIPVDVAQKYRIRFDPIANRVCFPVYAGSYLVGWQGRAIYDDVEPKALTSAGFVKSKFLMFNGRDPQKHMVLCEGPIDAIKADLVGGNVCSMGKMISPDQLLIIKNSGIDTLYLALDPDAHLEMEKIVKYFYGNLHIKQIPILAGRKDLGEMSFKEVQDAFSQSVDLNPNKLFIYLKND